MYQGVLCFSSPLSHGILSSHEHKALFQNVEKLSTISEYHLKLLKGAGENVLKSFKLLTGFIIHNWQHYVSPI